MSYDLIMRDGRVLYIDRDPEEGFMLIGSYSLDGGGIYLSEVEAVDFYEALGTELRIKGAIPWEQDG